MTNGAREYSCYRQRGVWCGVVACGVVSCGVVRCRVAVAWRGVAAHAPCTNTVGGCPRTNQRARTCAPRTPGATAPPGLRARPSTQHPAACGSPSPRRPPPRRQRQHLSPPGPVMNNINVPFGPADRADGLL